MMNPKTKKAGGTGLKVLAVCIPALLAFWQARLEARDKARAAEQKATANTEAGYAALVKSVGELQGVAEAQHEYIVKLEAHVEVLEKVVLASNEEPAPHGTVPVGKPGTVGHGAGTGSGYGTGTGHVRKAPPLGPPVGVMAKPDFTRPPPDIKGARDRADQMKQDQAPQ